MNSKVYWFLARMVGYLYRPLEILESKLFDQCLKKYDQELSRRINNDRSL